MKITLDTGDTLEVRVGQALTGLAVTQVEVTSSDALQPEFREWFASVVCNRFAPPAMEWGASWA